MGSLRVFGKVLLLVFTMVLGATLTCGAFYVDPKEYGSPMPMRTSYLG